jgi:hypothetical protein
MSPSAQDAPDGQSQRAAQIVGLVEAALERSDGMERDWHDRIRAGQQICAGLAHQRAERSGQQAPALVLERMHDRSQRALVPAGASRQRIHRRLPAASRAVRVRVAPVVQPIAAPRTQRR